MMPWRRLLRAALAMGVAPAAFWNLSVREWRALNAGPRAHLPRRDFDALAARFPDVIHAPD